MNDNREFELMLCFLRLATQLLRKYHSYKILVLILTAFLTSLPFVPLIYFFSFSCCKAKKSDLTDLDTLAANMAITEGGYITQVPSV